MSKTKRGSDRKSRSVPSQNLNPTHSNQQGNLAYHQYVLDLVNTWINNTDTKVSIACGLFTMLSTILAFCAEQLLADWPKSSHLENPLYYAALIALVIGVLTFLCAFSLYLSVIIPRLWSPSKHTSSTSTEYSVFFADISKHESWESYSKSAERLSETQFTSEIIKEIYTNSKICSKKTRLFRNGTTLAICSLSLLTISLALLMYLTYHWLPQQQPSSEIIEQTVMNTSFVTHMLCSHTSLL